MYMSNLCGGFDFFDLTLFYGENILTLLDTSHNTDRIQQQCQSLNPKDWSRLYEPNKLVPIIDLNNLLNVTAQSIHSRTNVHMTNLSDQFRISCNSVTINSHIYQV